MMQSIPGKRNVSSSDSSVDTDHSCMSQDAAFENFRDLWYQKYESPVSIEQSRRKPFAANFRCSLCRRTYLNTVYDNPWYVNVREQCPHCKECQMPTIDIDVPINARELDPNVESFYQCVEKDEYLDLKTVDECEDFAMELTEPVLKLIFAEQFPDALLNIRLPTQRENQSLSDVVNLRLLSLVIHAVQCRCLRHINVKQTTLCHNTKVLLLHLIRCRKLDDCQFPHCFDCRSVVSYLSTFPVETVFPAST